MTKAFPWMVGILLGIGGFYGYNHLPAHLPDQTSKLVTSSLRMYFPDSTVPMGETVVPIIVDGKTYWLPKEI